MKRSGSEQRRQKRLLGLRLDDDLYHLLRTAARRAGEAPTSHARRLIARALCPSGKEPTRARPRRKRAPPRVGRKLEHAARFLGLLAQVSRDLHQALQVATRARAEQALAPAPFDALRAEVARSAALYARIVRELADDHQEHPGRHR